MQILTKKSSAGEGGFTLIEVAVTMVVMSLILASFGIATSAVFDAREATRQKEILVRDAALAMQRMVAAIREAPALMLPLADNPASSQNESLRAQRVPPDAGKEKETAVLALRMSATADRNADRIPDVDNDADGRIDEDPGPDVHNDRQPGIVKIDDNNDGLVDNGSSTDDDEDGPVDEDPHGNGDEDKDLSIDDDPPGDLNNDKAPGIAGTDDDGDGQIDEGSELDDDEDGFENEDWYDPVVFYLDGNKLIERQPFPYDFDGSGSITGSDFMEAVIAGNVSYFRVERIARPAGRSVLVDITLELSGPGGESVSLSTRIRVGGSS